MGQQRPQDGEGAVAGGASGERQLRGVAWQQPSDARELRGHRQPTFFDAALHGVDVVGDDVSGMPVSAELVGATEGLLIDLSAPCATRTGESCGLCFNGKPEKAQLDALLKSGTALALAGGSASMSFQSQHKAFRSPVTSTSQRPDRHACDASLSPSRSRG
jgi:hypothetical protein